MTVTGIGHFIFIHLADTFIQRDLHFNLDKTEQLSLSYTQGHTFTAVDTTDT